MRGWFPSIAWMGWILPPRRVLRAYNNRGLLTWESCFVAVGQHILWR